jgi:hypothetical protein
MKSLINAAYLARDDWFLSVSKPRSNFRSLDEVEKNLFALHLVD